jgi:drug/metabolite transporter (DMT)-like permease
MSEVMSDMVLQISRALIYISYFSIVVPCYFLLRKKHILKFRQYRLLGILFLVSVVADAGSFILAHYGISNIPVINLYFIVSFGIISLMYARLLRSTKHAIYSFFGVTFAFFILDCYYIQGFGTLQSYVATLCGILAIGYSVIYYDHLLNTIPVSSIRRLPFFWINTAVAYYFSFNLFILVFGTFIFENLKEVEIHAVWVFHNLNNIIKNGLFAIGLYYAGEKRTVRKGRFYKRVRACI